MTARAGVVEVPADRGSASRHVDADDPVFAGHYPGFPVLPGLYLVRFADQVVRGLRGAGRAPRLAEVVSCRFLAPVYPGDDIRIDVVRRPGEDGQWAATVVVGAERAAEIRLRYREGDRS
ncbi:hypothetical protein AB0I60_01960 [Actinosynnema sp. NPDC050436]|uniref:3-hydroxyacyl-ACP dehydratase FabZ family protein n=1 Tax=Actinosynnema sp. NPDC050436 TaxID=3155659 RepID=UPI003400379B